MAPSRGRTSSLFPTLCHLLYNQTNYAPVGCTRRHASSRFLEAAQKSTAKCQIYISRLLDPNINLSIEHYLLQKTPEESTILYLYVNRPCVVIGRNQNPWLEVNLSALKNTRSRLDDDRDDAEGVLLVRRRSGGGTVYHDRGNINYSVICPTKDFTRDKHAEMVAAALRKLGIHSARVNERHDIIYGPSSADNQLRTGNLGLDQAAVQDKSNTYPLKVSGSAYKLTRGRALHHGTCLLSSNLDLIRQLLRSPVRPYIKARGVESVRSPVGNVYISHNAFQEAVIKEFSALHGLQDSSSLAGLVTAGGLQSGHGWVGGLIEETEVLSQKIIEGVEELKVVISRSSIRVNVPC